MNATQVTLFVSVSEIFVEDRCNCLAISQSLPAPCNCGIEPPPNHRPPGLESADF